jgi:hypothetical protein
MNSENSMLSTSCKVLSKANSTQSPHFYRLVELERKLFDSSHSTNVHIFTSHLIYELPIKRYPNRRQQESRLFVRLR